MEKFDSPFYPPRARWHSRLFHYPRALGRWLYLQRIRLPSWTLSLSFLVCLLLPGASFYLHGWRKAGQAILCGYLLAGLIFIIWLGYPFANLLFGLMMMAHATSIIFLLDQLCPNERLRTRILVGLGISFIVSQLFYLPALGFAERHWCTPLSTHGQVFVVRSHTPFASVKRGDFIAYQVAEQGGHALYIRAGYGLDQVLGMPGDKIQFTANTFTVNNVNYPRLPNMPVKGDLEVPEKCWFVWPNLARSGHGQADEIYVSELIRGNGMIDQSRFVGKVFNHWFWRRQVIS